MVYHASIEITPNDAAHLWWNQSADDLRSEVILPFVNRQVIETDGSTGPEVLNMAVASFMAIFKTPKPLPEGPGGGAPRQLTQDAWRTKNNCTAEFLDDLRVRSASPPTRSLLQDSVGESEQRIFVIMKFGDELLDSAYTGVIRPEGKRAGYAVTRIDEVQDSGRITDQILAEIGRSRIVIADLSGERPNCYYEAGFAHAIGKELILTIREGDEPHFDLAGYRFIKWRTEADLRKQLRARLRSLKQSGVKRG